MTIINVNLVKKGTKGWDILETKYKLPDAGIPESDLSADVREKLNRQAPAATHTLTVTYNTFDKAKPVADQKVTLYENINGELRFAAERIYNAAPVTFTVPFGFNYRVEIEDNLEGYYLPEAKEGTIIENTSITGNYTKKAITFEDLATIAASPEFYQRIGTMDHIIGYEIPDIWNDGNTNINAPLRVVDFQKIKDENGVSHTAAILQRSRAIYALPFNGAGGSNIWGHSFYRNYLNNPTGEKGTNWYDRSDPGYAIPTGIALNNLQTYFVGCSDELKYYAKPIKIITGNNNETIDTIWLPSGRNMCFTAHPAEGNMFKYWQTQLGISADGYTNAANAKRIVKDIGGANKLVMFRTPSSNDSEQILINDASGAAALRAVSQNSYALPCVAIY